MTNFEKYKDEILENAVKYNSNPAKEAGIIIACKGLSCSKCDFNAGGRDCRKNRWMWLYEDTEPDCDSEPEEPFEGIRSCENCIHDDKSENERPCVECCERYPLKFEPKPKEPELKPCPFCGGDGRVVADGGGNYTIQCNNCASFMGWFTSREKVIEAWNRRKGE